MIWVLKHPQATPEMLGYIPQFLSEKDPRPAAEQINENYSHGGGWHPAKGFTLLSDGNLRGHPSDPPYRLIATTQLRDEKIRFYESAWLAIIQPNGDMEVSRID
jgi:hypothetical protein